MAAGDQHRGLCGKRERKSSGCHLGQSLRKPKKTAAPPWCSLPITSSAWTSACTTPGGCLLTTKAFSSFGGHCLNRRKRNCRSSRDSARRRSGKWQTEGSELPSEAPTLLWSSIWRPQGLRALTRQDLRVWRCPCMRGGNNRHLCQVGAAGNQCSPRHHSPNRDRTML